MSARPPALLGLAVLVAATLPASSPRAIAEATARPFGLHAAHTGRVGTTARVRIRAGGAGPARLCVTAPGGEPACRPVAIPPGARVAAVPVPLTRPGGWSFVVRSAGGPSPTRHLWASHPGGRITLYAAGDSEMQILDGDLATALGPHRVSVVSDARISSGLTTPILNWQNEARDKAAGVRPDVSVVFMGANDGFGVPAPGGGQVDCCSAAWSAGYGGLVAEMMRTLLRGPAGRVYWFLLPTPRPSNFQSLFDAVNAGIRDAARRFPGRVGLIDANAFFTPGNRYRDTMTYDGHTFTIHEPDGIHLSSAADAVAAQLVVRRLKADHIIR